MPRVKHLFKIQELNWVGNFVLCFCAAMVSSACQKSSSPETDASAIESTNVASAVVSSSPTGLVKNATRHTEETANVTRWWDINEKKTAIQTAREEKLAKEAKELKLAQDTKLAQEAKILMAKAAASALTQVKPPVVTAPLVLKPVELTPAPVAAIKTSTPTPVPEALRFVSGSQPNFPATAARAGHTQGFVIARLSIEKNGSVSKVEIIDSNPKKVFDKEVVNTLSFWKYAAISTPQTKMVELQFKTDN